MKLSEAIRLGAMQRPQAFGSLRRQIRLGFLGLFGQKEIRTCALGAAFEAAACPEVPGVSDGRSGFRGTTVPAGLPMESIIVPTDWWCLFQQTAQCPDCGYASYVERMIPHLNDKHRWTRETIASFVENLERPYNELERRYNAAIQSPAIQHAVTADAQGGKS
jgi:hypothetical protein